MTATALRRPLRTAVVGLTSASLALFGIVAVSAPASADPNLDRVRAEITEVSDKVDELYREAEVANERYLKAEGEYADAEKRLAASSKAVEQQQAKLTEMTADMGGFAAAAYRQGVVDSTLHLVLSNNPKDALNESIMLDAYATSQSTALAVIATERAALSQKQADVEEEAALLEQIEKQMADEKATLESKVDEAEALVASLKSEERQILAEIEAERRAEAAVQAARDSERTAPTTTEQAATVADPEPAPPAPPASGRGAAAASFALAQIGDAYVYGGTGPNGWDCSGLTSGAWAAAGVSIPRTSQAQFYGLPRVSMDALQPGDIIGYYGGISHVGIYIGNGQIVHSSRPGRPVSIAPLYSMPAMGAVRPG